MMNQQNDETHTTVIMTSSGYQNYPSVVMSNNNNNSIDYNNHQDQLQHQHTSSLLLTPTRGDDTVIGSYQHHQQHHNSLGLINQLEQQQIITTTNNRHYNNGHEQVRRLCQICGDISAGYHCNAFVCEACKKFFVRSSRNENFTKYICSKTQNCQITKDTRTHCQKCRFYKCLKIGMQLPGLVVTPTTDISMIPCRVCGANSSGFHFGAITCEGCKGFFRRTVNERENHRYSCRNNGRCHVTLATRNNCKSCRFRRCLQAGMSKEGSRIGRQPNSVKHMCAIEIEQIKQSTTHYNYDPGTVTTATTVDSNHGDQSNTTSVYLDVNNVCEGGLPFPTSAISQNGQTSGLHNPEESTIFYNQHYLCQNTNNQIHGNFHNNNNNDSFPVQSQLDEDDFTMHQDDEAIQLMSGDYHNLTQHPGQDGEICRIYSSEEDEELCYFRQKVVHVSAKLTNFIETMRFKRLRHSLCETDYKNYWRQLQANYDEHLREILSIAQTFIVNLSQLECDEIIRTAQYPIMLIMYSFTDYNMNGFTCFNFNQTDSSDLSRSLPIAKLVIDNQREVMDYKLMFDVEQIVLISLLLIFDKKDRIFYFSMREFKRQIETWIKTNQRVIESLNHLIKRLSEMNCVHAKSLVDMKMSNCELTTSEFLEKLSFR